MNEKPTLVPAPESPDADDTRQAVDATRREARGGQTAPTMQQGDDTAADEDSLEDRIRKRLAASDSEDTRPKADPLIGRDIAGRFQIYKKIGAGGMGAVYRARQKGMDRDVAIKVLLRELTENETVLRRFHIEALAVSKLKHPNTIQIFDFGETEDGLLFIAMEFLEGMPLQKHLKEEHQLSVRRSVNIALQITRSLREAHSKGIVHRDLKPDNVILETVGEERDYVKVLDFGVAKLAEGDGQQKTLTKAGSIFGTPKYMSPEQSRGGDIDARSDIYSIGVLLYEMLLGRVPFNAENPLGILIKHLQELPPAFQQMRPDLVVPEGVEDFVMRTLEKDPAKRPQTAEAVIRELEKLLADLPEIFRNVVTREDAEAAGIEITTSSRTAHDTDIAGVTGTTVGPFTDKTIFTEPKTKRRLWPLVAMGAVILVLGGGGALYASLDQLPRAYTDFTAVSAQSFGTVPEFDLRSVFVNVVSDPLGAEVLNAKGEIVGQTPYLLRKNQGAPEESYTFRKKGYQDYARSFAFAEDATVTFQLVADEPVVVETPVVKPPVVRPVDPGTPTRPPGDVTSAVKPPADKPAEFNPTRVKDIKATPFGDPKRTPELKPNPFQP